MRIKSEAELLDPGVRKQLVQEIEGQEERDRRIEAYVKDQVYRDQVDRFVKEKLIAQFDRSTVSQMQFAISNISLTKKIINKLARVYNHGVVRLVGEDEESTDKLNQLEKKLNINQRMKDQNRLTKLQHNAMFYLKPCPFMDKDNNIKWRVKPQPMAPYLYSVVENFWDRERPMAYILSNFTSEGIENYTVDPNTHARGTSTVSKVFKGDGTDQGLADNKEDEDNGDITNDKKYIVWSDKYHFTMDGTGSIIDKEGNPMDIVDADDERILNPIEEVPMVNYAINQNNSFWAEGGSDIPLGDILVNCLITHYNHIAVTQGYGQLVMEGSNLPQTMEIGPTKAIKLERENPDDPASSVNYINANPNLSDFLTGIEMYVALMLSTNNLSTSGVATQLGNGASPGSGIALIIDKSESMEDVEDQQQVFLDNEPDYWRKLNKLNEHFASEGMLDPEFEGLILPEGFDEELIVRLGKPSVIISEKERLEIIEKRKALGINEQIDLIKLDNPDMTDEQAEAKLARIMEENLAKMSKKIAESQGFGDNEEVDGKNNQDEGEQR